MNIWRPKVENLCCKAAVSSSLETTERHVCLRFTVSSQSSFFPGLLGKVLTWALKWWNAFHCSSTLHNWHQAKKSWYLLKTFGFLIHWFHRGTRIGQDSCLNCVRLSTVLSSDWIIGFECANSPNFQKDFWDLVKRPALLCYLEKNLPFV